MLLLLLLLVLPSGVARPFFIETLKPVSTSMEKSGLFATLP